LLVYILQMSKPKNPANFYWDPKLIELAIIKYNAARSMDTKNQIFESELHKPLNKLIENLYNRFKLSYFETEYATIQKETLSFLVTILDKFDPIRGKGKSFGFFSVVARNYLINLNNANYKHWNRSISIDIEAEDSDENHKVMSPTLQFTPQLSLEDKNNKLEFIKLLRNFWFSVSYSCGCIYELTQINNVLNRVNFIKPEDITLETPESRRFGITHLYSETHITHRQRYHKMLKDNKKIYKYYIENNILPDIGSYKKKYNASMCYKLSLKHDDYYRANHARLLKLAQSQDLQCAIRTDSLGMFDFIRDIRQTPIEGTQPELDTNISARNQV
jgi:hypothetical protein